MNEIDDVAWEKMAQHLPVDSEKCARFRKIVVLALRAFEALRVNHDESGDERDPKNRLNNIAKAAKNLNCLLKHEPLADYLFFGLPDIKGGKIAKSTRFYEFAEKLDHIALEASFKADFISSYRQNIAFGSKGRAAEVLVNFLTEAWSQEFGGPPVTRGSHFIRFVSDIYSFANAGKLKEETVISHLRRWRRRQSVNLAEQ